MFEKSDLNHLKLYDLKQIQIFLEHLLMIDWHNRI